MSQDLEISPKTVSLQKLLGDSSLTESGLFEGLELFLKSATYEEIEEYEKSLAIAGITGREEFNDRFMRHYLDGGMYARTIFLPKGIFAIGKVHKGPYIDIMISGDMTINSYHSDGRIDLTERVNGFNYLKGWAGRKRVGFAHEDTLWITVDLCKSENIDNAECEIALDNLAQYNKMIGEKCQSLPPQ